MLSRPCIDCKAAVALRSGLRCGLTSKRCLKCREEYRRQRARAWYTARRPQRSACVDCGDIVSPSRSRRCPSCLVKRHRFQKRQWAEKARRLLGVQPRRKMSACVSRERRRAQNRARAAYKLAWQRANLQRHREACVRHYRKDIQRSRMLSSAAAKRFRLRHPDKVRANVTKWRRLNQQRVIQYAYDRRTAEILAELPEDVHVARLLLRKYRARVRGDRSKLRRENHEHENPLR